jgi:GntR family transcriptional regulator
MNDMWLSINEKDSRPIYLQIISQVKEQVGNGTLKPGTELPSVREMADSLGINLHTVRSAYLKLRDQGVIELRLGRRAKIARLPEPGRETETLAAGRLENLIKELVTEAQLLGLNREQLHRLIDRQTEDKKEG